MSAVYTNEAIGLLERFEAFLADETRRSGGPCPAVRPPHRVPFEWPKHSIAAKYHIPQSAWTGRATLYVDGEGCLVECATTEYGVFGRCERYWVEGRGATVEALLANLKEECAPLWARQRAVGAALGREGRVEQPVANMSSLDLLRLLYCEDRDVANEAAIAMEESVSSGRWGPSLLAVMRDQAHPLRRQAQWCVLDLMEDLIGIFRTSKAQSDALEVLRGFLWTCEDDYARTCYKCGDVLGDHVADDRAADLLLDVLANAPSRFGRRSAIHGLIHVTEWLPERKGEVLKRLLEAGAQDPDALLRDYCRVAIEDIESGAPSLHPHGPEPVFEGE